jgi:hypothetical protein
MAVGYQGEINVEGKHCVVNASSRQEALFIIGSP